jgi:hypothetical protein
MRSWIFESAVMDCKRPNPLTREWLLPILPNAGDPEWRSVLHGDGVGLPGPLSLDGLPLEEAVHRKDASSLSDMPPEMSAAARLSQPWH